MLLQKHPYRPDEADVDVDVFIAHKAAARVSDDVAKAKLRAAPYRVVPCPDVLCSARIGCCDNILYTV